MKCGGRHDEQQLGSEFRITCGVVVLCVALTACGYRHRPIFLEDVGTVAVINFANRTYYKDVEFSLTEAIKKEIEWRTPYKVTERAKADTILTGEIVRIEQRMLSRRPQGGLPQDLEYQIVVTFQWKDLRNGKALRNRQGMQVVAPYQPARPISEPQAMGQDRTVQRVADRIVSVMKSDL